MADSLKDLRELADWVLVLPLLERRLRLNTPFTEISPESSSSFPFDRCRTLPLLSLRLPPNTLLTWLTWLSCGWLGATELTPAAAAAAVESGDARKRLSSKYSSGQLRKKRTTLTGVTTSIKKASMVVVPGWRRLGPNIVARLFRLILFSAECIATLFLGWGWAGWGKGDMVKCLTWSSILPLYTFYSASWIWAYMQLHELMY